MKFPTTPSFRLENKRALVTGAGRGIGLGAAIALSEAGSEVVMLSRTKEDLEKILEKNPNLSRQLSSQLSQNNFSNMQIDAALQPGNSGGPIVDEESGDLVGVANMKLDSSISEGTNFAIKASTIENFLSSNKVKPSTTYLSFGKSRKGLLKLLESSTVFVYCE